MIRAMTDEEIAVLVTEADELRRTERRGDHEFGCECAACIAGELLVAERMFWRPTDWSTVPAWRAWRAEVGARRRPTAQDDALLAAAHLEMLACLYAQCDRNDLAETYFRWADETITEGLAA